LNAGGGGFPEAEDGSPEPATVGARSKVAGDHTLDWMPQRRVATVGSERARAASPPARAMEATVRPALQRCQATASALSRTWPRS
jgi:hypothetical protein